MSNIEDLLAVMARLRSPDGGCPWDLQQTLQSLVPHTIEEAYEVAEAAAAGDVDELCSELGDLLFQVVFYARIAEEQGEFDFAAVVDAITSKLIRRHPHVFADAHIADAESQTRAWEAHKAAERRKKTASAGTIAGVALALPALSRAAKLQRRAARVGFDWPALLPVFDKVEEELAEVRQEVEQDGGPDRLEDEIGDLLFACTNLARKADIDPEAALRRANAKFEQRFEAMEAIAAERGWQLETLELDTWEALWLQAKQAQTQLND